MAIALDYHLGPRQEIILAGTRDDHKTNILLESINQHYLPRSIVLFKPKFRSESIVKQIPYLKEYKAVKGQKASVFICSNYSCLLPVSEASKVNKLLSKYSGRK